MSTRPPLTEGSLSGRSLGILLILFLSIFGIGFASFYYASVITQTPRGGTILSGDGFQVYLYQEVNTILVPNATTPIASAAVNTIFYHEFDASTNLTTNNPSGFVELISMDSKKYFEPTKSLQMKAIGEANRDLESVNMSTWSSTIMDYDETAEFGVYYLITLHPSIDVSDYLPFSCFIITCDNGTDSVRIGYNIYGNNRDNTTNSLSEFTTGGVYEDRIPDIWYNRNTSTYTDIWGLFLIDDLRTDIENIIDFVYQNINITSVEFYTGYDCDCNQAFIYTNWDYCQIITKPTEHFGVTWYDENDEVVNNYQINTYYLIVALDFKYNISESGVISNMSLFIKDYVNITRLVPDPDALIVTQLLTYLDVINLNEEVGLNITSTTYNNSTAWKIEGMRSSNPIPLPYTTALGTTLNYTVAANFTIEAEMNDGEWDTDSLETADGEGLYDAGFFTIHTGTSIFITLTYP